jgi:hypothetical protein
MDDRVVKATNAQYKPKTEVEAEVKGKVWKTLESEVRGLRSGLLPPQFAGTYKKEFDFIFYRNIIDCFK